MRKEGRNAPLTKVGTSQPGSAKHVAWPALYLYVFLQIPASLDPPTKGSIRFLLLVFKFDFGKVQADLLNGYFVALGAGTVLV